MSGGRQLHEPEAVVEEARRRRSARPRSLIVVCCIAAIATAGASTVALAKTVGGRTPPPAIAIGVGDIVKVGGAPIGCAVRREAGEVALDCRRIGPLHDTYGAILTRRRLLVVRFVDKTTATVVFTARHGSMRAHTCG